MLSRRTFAAILSLFGIAILVFGVADPRPTQGREDARPAKAEPAKPDVEKPADAVGDAKAGRDVFRFETFGNEGFWTDAMRLPKGMEDEKFTPLQALEAGLHVDVEALDDELKKALGAELKTDLSAKNAPMLNDPKTTMKLVKANAVIGVVAKGEKVGISCAICHTITDSSVFAMPGKGSVGRRLDGRATHSLDMGKLLAMAANSRAYYPNLQLELGGKTIGRAPKGIRRDSTEAEVDAYLRSDKFYPRGTFDETQDGIGNPVQNTPLFRQDLAAPYGSNGMHETFEGISNASYTTNLDMTTLATPEGKELLVALAGKNGEELHENYVAILKETGVTGYPFVTAKMEGKVGHRNTPVGRQVDKKKLLDMKAYTFSLKAPAAPKVDPEAFARGGLAFRGNACETCHDGNPANPVPTKIVALKDLWPAYAPEKLAERKKPLSAIENSPGGYDDKMVILDASERGEKRGVPLPLLLDLARKPRFLHDDSVASLDSLLDPKRGAKEPHPFYLKDAAVRSDVIAFLKALSPGENPKGDAPKEDTPSIKRPGPAPKKIPVVPAPDAEAAEVPPGFQVEIILSDLEYPSSIEFDDKGAMYVAEAGNIDGAWVARARVLKYTWPVQNQRVTEVVADQLSGPVTDLLWHKGKLYISHRGKISVLEKGKVRDLVTDLPSFGDHHNNQLTVGPDGKIYFGQGTATNSGVVGVDNFLLGWLSPYPNFCDVPGKDIALRGQAFESADPLTALAKNKARTVKTSAFQPFGSTASDGAVVKGKAKATGSILRMDDDGKNLEVYAWGLRNPFGVMWGPDKKLYASENGADERGVRPIADCPDNLWLIKEGAWYGWPDYASGIPVTDARFKPKDGPSPEFLMKDHPAVEKPLMTFKPHASVTKIDFSTSAKFGFEGQMFLAASGDYCPATSAKQERSGYWVQRIDPATKKGEVFFRAKKETLGAKDEEYVTTAGPKRPVDVRFYADALYVVDIGAVVFTTSGTGPTPRPYPGTGVVWRISRTPGGR